MTMKKKIFFCVVMLISTAFLIELSSFLIFSFVEKQWFSFSRISSERNKVFQEVSDQNLAAAEKGSYDFLNNLTNADVITESKDYVGRSRLSVNHEEREVLFEHPNSEVVFKALSIEENARLEFGIGIKQDAWDKAGDGVLFEVVVIDERSQEHSLFSAYLDPKNNVQDRRWFDRKVDLSVFAEQEVSLVFKTTAGPNGDRDYDWAGWSRPQIRLNGGEETAPLYLAPEVIHPYVGFVLNPEYYPAEVQISEYGFVGENSPIQTKSNDNVIVGVFGGSVAAKFSELGRASLLSELRKSPIFHNKEFVFVTIALGGFKQPQQLMALNYLLSLGGHFDIIINLDGFNEVALPVAENVSKNVFPFFPRSWFLRVQDLPDLTNRVIVGEIAYLKSKRKNWAGLFAESPLRYSVFLNLIWKYYDRRLAAAISKDELRLQSYKPQVGGYVATGPSRQYETEADLFEDLAFVWKMSSLQMHRLSTANGIRYFHFLQPNQYVAGSKIMGKEESDQAILDTHPYKTGAEKGYAYLRKAGRELADREVNFHDLTMIFAAVGEPLYVDTCCHVNKKGYEILGTAIGRAVIRDIKGQKLHK